MDRYEPATFDVEVMSDGGAQRLLSLHGVTSPPGVGDTMTIGDGFYQVRRRHWSVGRPNLGGDYQTSIGTVELYVRRISFTGPYGRQPAARTKAAAS